jgi:hypothetical protein
MEKYTDQSLMHFGKFKGEPMEKVPARYLLWLWNEGMVDEVNIHPETPRQCLALYIAENLTALQMEDKDTLVKKGVRNR